MGKRPAKVNQKRALNNLWRRVFRRVPKRTRRRSPATLAYERHREAARAVITARVVHFATAYGFTYNRIAIRNQRRAWGSCSTRRNLNFSYKLLFLPPCIRDYVVVHELCHLRQFNHQPAFWQEVSSILPTYALPLAQLRQLEKLRGTSLAALAAYTPDHGVTCSYCLTATSTTMLKETAPRAVIIEVTTTVV